MTDALIIDVVFSFEVQPGDPIIRLVEEASETTKETVVAGVWLGVCQIEVIVTPP